ncbi:MAG: hypothetical protein KDB27_33255 [Planctomycetales bacterium]|nr:hypothetical protein [Planctomycetales bacterium]
MTETDRAKSPLCPCCSTSDPLQAVVVPPPVSESAFSENKPGPETRTGVVLSPFQLGAVGCLLISTGVIAFGLGVLCGQRNAVPDANRVPQRTTISGRVHDFPEGSVLICLPVNSRPEQKLALAHNSTEELLSDQLPGKQLAAIDGRVSGINSDGRFQIDLIVPGEYFFLCLADGPSSGPDTRTLAQLGRYFLRGNELLKRFQWRWVRKRIDADADFAVVEL